jgi:amidase
MAEWANFRSTRSINGWSARGGLTRNPHSLDRSAGGSSSGSAVAVAAGIVPLAIGSETDGSILNPAAYNGIVGLKPTVGSVDGRGVVPISHAQDTLGPLARTVRDAAMVLAVLSGVDHTGSCRTGAAAGLRVGLLDQRFWGNHPAIPALIESVVRALGTTGTAVVDQVDLPGATELAESGAERIRLLNDFRCDLASYLATRTGPGPANLADLIEFNTTHADEELRYFGQEILQDAADTEGMSESDHRAAVATCLRCGRDEGIDAALLSAAADCLIVPHFDPTPKLDLVNGDRGSWLSPRPSAVQAAAVAGYPAVAVPIGDVEGLPISLTILGNAHSEPRLLAIAFAIEAAMDAWLTPQFRLPSVG